MSKIISAPYEEFDLKSITLGTPYTQDGTIQCDILFNNSKVFLQTPSCSIKEGIKEITTNTKRKIYADLMFDKKYIDFINFIQSLEDHIKEILKEKKDVWFANDLTDDDIEQSFISSLKYFRKRYMLKILNQFKKYTCLGKNINDIIKVFDEHNNTKTISDINEDSEMISILQVCKVKCSNISFSLEFMMKQFVILDSEDKFNECLIVLDKNKENKNTLENLKNIEEPSNENIEEPSNENIEEPSNENIEEPSNENKEQPSNENKEEPSNENKEEHSNENKEDNLENNSPNENNIIMEVKETVEQEIVNENGETLEKAEETVEQEIVNENGETSEKIEEIVEQETLNFDNVDKEIEESLGKLQEIDINVKDNNESISLKNHNEVIIDIYKAAREKAKFAKKQALAAYLEVQNIKNTYMLDEIEDSDEEDDLESLNY